MSKIIVTGPESSGKTTLFNKLIKSFGVIGVEEYAREYINQLNEPYCYNDILEIAIGQLKNEMDVIKLKQSLLIGDTDLLTLLIWSEFKYKKCHSFIKKNLSNHLPDVYLLCYPDIPWVYDSQRENPNERLELFTIYEQKIKSLEIDYHIIRGNEDVRLEKSKTIINNIKKF